ncbi:SUMF1/EgtB/PvdO family nonheme iron enzyme [Scytonema sp. UIC 10036]|uniref:formylglycine-generating enzyme family protein n=1 Tax=Scytonema sp. UIC 10036 TaxID=2304196 RepID=UPI0012DA5B6E|nr:formylglycine-generating enzyme family protein [Scytonema sp. UIC 10036]MUG96827.1 SUMF1/EgtB/PvdO family nonheme iron enzyme [Scytonema sp. UIC 10036]
MNNLPRQKLCEVISKYGQSLCDEPKQCEALLRDLCGQYSGEIFVLMSALKNGVAKELLSSKKNIPTEMLLARLTKQIHDRLYLAEDAVKWAVESWALALGIIVKIEENHFKVEVKGERKQINQEVVPEVIFVKGGTFKRGERGLFDNRTTITLSNFWMGKYPVTVKEYKAYCNATGNQMPSLPSWNQGESFPIILVCWYEAVTYCAWLSQITGLKFRLPTEAEWEFAARGGLKSNQFKWAGSNNPNFVAWFDKNSGSSSHPVGEKQPNELGIFDMSGNVSEWCFDWYGEYSPEPETNPKGPKAGENKVVRGGSWKHIDNKSKIFTRDFFWLASKYDHLGFRVLREQ